MNPPIGEKEEGSPDEVSRVGAPVESFFFMLGNRLQAGSTDDRRI